MPHGASNGPSSTDAAPPLCHWLSNERYAVLLTASGSGCSAFDDFLLTTWHTMRSKETTASCS